jgi:hypothetical protein
VVSIINICLRALPALPARGLLGNHGCTRVTR